jgi:hypothetical protein
MAITISKRLAANKLSLLNNLRALIWAADTSISGNSQPRPDSLFDIERFNRLNKLDRSWRAGKVNQL